MEREEYNWERAGPQVKQKVQYVGKGVIRKYHARSGVWWYYARFALPDGRRRTEKAGTTRRQAERLRDRRRGEVVSGTYEDPGDKSVGDGPRFKDFAERFLRDYGDLRKSDYYRHSLSESRGLMEYFGELPLREIAEADIDQFRRSLEGKLRPSTIRKYLTVLGTMFRRAKRWGDIDVNPAADLDKPKEPKHRIRYLAVDEWRALYEAAEPWLKPILRMAICTGARLKEVVSLTWDNVDRQAGVLHVTVDNKTGTPRQIPLGRTAREVLDSQVRHVRSRFVFVDEKGVPYTSEKLRNRISHRTRRAMRAAKVQGASFHTLRHTVGSWLGQKGFSEMQIGALLGHAGASMTGRYVHFQVEDLRAMVSMLDECLAGDQFGDLNSSPSVSC